MTTKSQVSRRAWTPATSKSRVSAGVQAGVPGYSVNLLLFTYWYFSSGHLRFSGRWCPNLNLAKISLSLSRLKSTHDLRHVFLLYYIAKMTCKYCIMKQNEYFFPQKQHGCHVDLES